jgi:hypothetical protein
MNQNMCAFHPEEIIMENFSMGDHWGTVELMKRYPIQNNEHWSYVCDPMDVDHDLDVAKKITCISDTEFDPWFRKMIPWKWRNFDLGKNWDTPTPHMFLKGKKKYALAERHTTIEGKTFRLYKRIYDY